MRFSTAVAGLSACLAPVAALINNADAKVPGESPLLFCPGDRSKDIVQIESVDLNPNPPKSGSELLIKATGTVNETIREGAYVKLRVKYGLITLINTSMDLCDQVKTDETLKCPIKPGHMETTRTASLPESIPPGKYSVVADVYNADDKHITCLEAEVTFTVGAGSFFDNEL